jgi:hypothetical protein
MSRKLTTRAARKIAAARKTHSGAARRSRRSARGRGFLCTSTRDALGHC